MLIRRPFKYGSWNSSSMENSELFPAFWAICVNGPNIRRAAGMFLGVRSEWDEVSVDKNTDLTSGMSDEVQRELQR